MMSRNFGKPTKLVDVYSFAMIIFELVTLQLPFNDWEEPQIAVGVPNGERPDIPPNCDSFIKQLILDCWQGEPTKRPDFRQILERLKSQKEESMWPIEFPHLQKFSTQFPYVGKIPKPAFDIIDNGMNLKEIPGNWEAFVSEIRPTYTAYDLQIQYKKKMKSVLDELSGQGERTTKLLNLLEKVKRRDILINLEEYSR